MASGLILLFGLHLRDEGIKHGGGQSHHINSPISRILRGEVNRPFMKLSISILLLIAFISVSAQSPTDTVFWEGGAQKQVQYYSLKRPIDLSRAEMFMRGIHPGDEVVGIRVLDSVRVYDESGTYLKTMSGLHWNSRNGTPRSDERDKGIRPKANEYLEAKPSAPYLEGRAGMLIRQKVWLPAGKNFEEVRRLDQHPDIEILKTPADTNGSFTAKIRLPAGASTPKLRLDVGEETYWEKPFSLRGYHLNETDFKRRDQLTEAQTWRAEGQQLLYLRLRSTEKLMHVYRDDEQYTVLPVGRQLDEVRIGILSPGKYLLEIIDLGTREKRYHWIVAGK